MMRREQSKLANETQHSNGPLSEPHFDDEATLLSARRVVPLHKVTERTNSKRVLGATLVAALVMGIVGGVIYARLERTPVSKAETTEPVAQPALPDDFVSSSVQSDDLTSAPAEAQDMADDKGEQKTIEKPRNPSTSARKRVSLNPAPARRVQNEPDEWDHLASEREMRRAERRAARRARREATRETQRSDDLFRIREIFEGSSRP